jgi:hypothetical protein
MALQWKKNSRYPSVTKPGVFSRIQELDIVTGEDILEDTWFRLTGIDGEEMNKFKFALGTWTQISRRNRKIKVISADLANSITVVAADEEEAITEPKPNYLPENYVEDIFAWANNIEEAKKGNAVNDGIFQLDGPTAAGYGPSLDGLTKYRETHGGKWRFMKLDGISKIGWNSYAEHPNATLHEINIWIVSIGMFSIRIPSDFTYTVKFHKSPFSTMRFSIFC